jgi:hypothetical protein
MSKKTLMERARLESPARKSRNKLPEDQLEDLALGYLTGEIRFVAVQKVLKRTGNAAYGNIASSLKRAFAKGRINLTKI